MRNWLRSPKRLALTCLLLYLLYFACRWGWDTRSLQAAFKDHHGIVLCVAFSPDGHRVASGGMDGTIRLLDSATAQEQACLRADGWVFRVAFSPDGKTLVACTRSGAMLWDVQTGTVRKQCATNGSQFCAIAPDCSRIADAVGKDLVLWELASDREMLRLRGHNDDVFCASFSPDGALLASGGLDHTVRLWNLPTGEEVACLRGHEGMVAGVSFSPDGQLLASHSGYDATVILWDMVTRKESAKWRAETSTPLRAIAFSPDSRLLATASGDNTSPFTSIHKAGRVRVWEIQSLQVKAEFRWHWGALSAVAFSPDGATIATACYDGRLRLWALSPVSR